MEYGYRDSPNPFAPLGIGGLSQHIPVITQTGLSQELDLVRAVDLHQTNSAASIAETRKE